MLHSQSSASLVGSFVGRVLNRHSFQLSSCAPSIRFLGVRHPRGTHSPPGGRASFSWHRPSGAARMAGELAGQDPPYATDPGLVGRVLTRQTTLRLRSGANREADGRMLGVKRSPPRCSGLWASCPSTTQPDNEVRRQSFSGLTPNWAQTLAPRCGLSLRQVAVAQGQQSPRIQRSQGESGGYILQRCDTPFLRRTTASTIRTAVRLRWNDEQEGCAMKPLRAATLRRNPASTESTRPDCVRRFCSSCWSGAAPRS